MKKIVFISLAVLLFCSCSDLLVEKPQAIAVETFYNTSGEIEAGVAAIYSPLRGQNVFKAEYLAMIEESSDIIFEGRGSWLFPSQYQGLDGANITRVQNSWNQLYLAVRNANIMIGAIPNASSVSDADKDRFMGEARFLRALAYFHLVRCWGAVPMRTEENVFEYSLPRSTVAEIYNLIVSDLQSAESGLPSTVSITGHPTRWAAKMLLADVYFTLNQYDKAAEKSNEVIQSGQYALVEVSTADDFEDLFGATVNNTSEEIFYVKYHEQDHWELMLYFHGVGQQYINRDGYYCIISNENYSVYVNQDDQDLRKALWYPYSGHDDGTLLLKKFTDKGAGAVAPRNAYPLYRYADCLLMYAEASCQASNGPTAAGLDALNKVHRRAYGHPSTQPSPVDFNLNDYNKDSFIELCMKERGYETVGEGKRWFDIKRTGNAAKYVRENRGKEIQEKHYLWPIPVSETNFNDAITDNNPGY